MTSTRGRNGPAGGGAHPNVWYPFTTIAGMSTPLKVVGGQGTRIVLEDGRSLLDCISSWWVNLYGHGHPKVADAIHAQALELEHVIFAGFTHEPAERLSESLAHMLPGDLSRVFFSDDGSTSVEVALKMAYQYWVNLGEPRSTFLAFDGAYHGDTFGAMSVGGESPFNGIFGDLLFGVERVPFPETWLGDASVAEREAAVLESLRERLSESDRPVAGVIAEPLVQGAGGMRMCRDDFLRGLRRVTAESGTLLILDEVMTGFRPYGSALRVRTCRGRPRHHLPVEGAHRRLPATRRDGGVEPGLRGVRQHREREDLLARPQLHREPARLRRGARLARAARGARSGLSAAWRSTIVTFSADSTPTSTARPRVTGTIVAFDLRTDGTGDYFDRVGPEIKRRAIEKGLLLRPLGNTIYLMPPYSMTKEEREEIYTRGVGACGGGHRGLTDAE